MNILDKILEKKKIEVELRKKSFPIEKQMLKDAPLRASFKDALTQKNSKPAIIAELKKASPSRGVIRENFDPETLARGLEKSGASALSVLTEKNFFLGSLDNLKIAVSQVKIPILRKDFIFDPYQLLEAKLFGASAALLIARMLKKDELKRLIDFAREIELDILTETHSAEEIEIVSECGAEIIGVNSRDLATFKTDLSAVSDLLNLIPGNCKKVAESGINTHEELEFMFKAKADACLIGGALMEAENPPEKLKNLLGL